MKILITSLLTLLAFNLSAQFVVSVPGAYAYHAEQSISNKAMIANTAKQIAEAKKQYDEVKKQTSFLNDAREALTNINNRLRDLDMVKRTIDQQAIAFNNAEAAIQYCKDSDTFNQDEINMIIYNFTRLVSATNTTVSLMNSILKDGLFKMSDAERFEILDKLNREAISTRNDVDRLYETYTRVARQRQMFQAFKRK